MNAVEIIAMITAKVKSVTKSMPSSYISRCRTVVKTCPFDLATLPFRRRVVDVERMIDAVVVKGRVVR